MISKSIMDSTRKLGEDFKAQQSAEWEAVLQRRHLFFFPIQAKYMDRFWIEVHQMSKLYSVARWKVESHGDDLSCIFLLGCDHPGGVMYAKFHWKEIRAS